MSNYFYNGGSRSSTAKCNKEKNDDDIEDKYKSKMQVANEAVVALLSKLRPEDCVSIVLFDDETEVLQPLTRVADLDLSQLAQKQLAVTPRGCTNMEAGFRQSVQELKSAAKK